MKEKMQIDEKKQADILKGYKKDTTVCHCMYACMCEGARTRERVRVCVCVCVCMSEKVYTLDLAGMA